MCGNRFGNLQFVCVDMEREKSDDRAERGRKEDDAFDSDVRIFIKSDFAISSNEFEIFKTMYSYSKPLSLVSHLLYFTF